MFNFIHVFFCVVATTSCAAFQEYLGLGTQTKPFMGCSLEVCSDWCRQEYGRSTGAAGYGCQIFVGVETLAFCECTDGGRNDPDVVPSVLCHEPLACSSCKHGYCSTSPSMNKLFHNLCVTCEPGFELLPTGACTSVDIADAESLYKCPIDDRVEDPCFYGKCVDGNATSRTSFSCDCNQGYEGPLCNAGIIELMR